ncbi:MAG: ECF transporter S component [Ardenticatenales bacterium]|nr:ECF transporter S component [Ardenticatenales bacterium]
MKKRSLDPRVVAVTAIMTAMVFVLTWIVQIPTPAKGYVHLGDAAVFFAALALGPWVGGIAGGLGTGLADIAGGWAQWAVFSFVIHGFQGWLVGVMVGRQAGWPRIVLAVGAGGAVVVVGYFIAGVILVGMGAAVAEVPANIVQALSGGLVGVPLFLAVRRAYPPLIQRR